MEKLTSKEYNILIKLVEARKDSIRKDSYTNKKVAEEYHDLGFIKVKLDTQLKALKYIVNS